MSLSPLYRCPDLTFEALHHLPQAALVDLTPSAFFQMSPALTKPHCSLGPPPGGTLTTPGLVLSGALGGSVLGPCHSFSSYLVGTPHVLALVLSSGDATWKQRKHSPVSAPPTYLFFQTKPNVSATYFPSVPS